MKGGTSATRQSYGRRSSSAAMEPPGEGRYEGKKENGPLTPEPPQWSRPVKGGTSYAYAELATGGTRPQWSRPVKGGTRACGRCPSVATSVPQWSRPVKGGTS